MKLTQEAMVQILKNWLAKVKAEPKQTKSLTFECIALRTKDNTSKGEPLGSTVVVTETTHAGFGDVVRKGN